MTVVTIQFEEVRLLLTTAIVIASALLNGLIGIVYAINGEKRTALVFAFVGMLILLVYPFSFLSV